nr:DNA repair protein RadA [Actinomycetota bacterium]
MAKTAQQFACTECGYTAGRWFGRCPSCSAFGTLLEEPVAPATTHAAAGVARPVLRLIDVSAQEADRI